MSTSIIGRPIKSDSNFNAAGNPVVYKLRREDDEFDSINNVGDEAQIQIDGVDLTDYYEVGDLIYIGRSGYKSSAIITASVFSTNTLITLSYPFVDSGDGYINNLSKRTDYRIEVEVFDYPTNVSMGARITAAPNISGDVSINISGIVSSYLSANWEDIVTIAREYESSREIYIKFEEYYSSEYHGVEDDNANPIVCVFAMINILQGSPDDFTRYQHGGNMYPFVHYESPGTLWMTRFPEMSMWRGWPFTISFPSAGFVSLKRRVKQYNSAGDEIANNVDVLTWDDQGIYRMDVGIVESDAKELIVTLETPDGLTVRTVPLTVKVKDPCPAQVLLFWKNSLCGDAFWMFDESQEIKYTYPSGRKVMRLRLYTDNLTIGEWGAINELNSTTDVMAANLTDYNMDNSIDKTHFRNDNQVFIINQNGEKVGVIVIETENTTKTMYKKHAAEITIELPELFTV